LESWQSRLPDLQRNDIKTWTSNIINEKKKKKLKIAPLLDFKVSRIFFAVAAV